MKAAFEVLWPDVDDEPRPLYWAAENSKRYFAAASAAGTIDQFLLSTLQTKHSHVRGTALPRALVVVDEVHASDPYMRVLPAMALQRHQAAGGHGMLLSALLTSDARAQLLATAPQPKPRLRGQRAAWAEERAAADASPAAPAPYPLLSAPQWQQAFEQPPWQKQISLQTLPLMRDAEAVAALAVQAVHAGARVLVLRNTVRQAVATQRALEQLLGTAHPALFRCQQVGTLHHGCFAFVDRQALDEAMTSQFGTAAASHRSRRGAVRHADGGDLGGLRRRLHNPGPRVDGRVFAAPEPAAPAPPA